MAYITLVASLIRFVLAEKTECLNELANLATSNPVLLGKMVYYSGRDVNDLGQFHECNDLPGARYQLLMFRYDVAFLVMGICGPSKCESKDYEENIKVFIQTHGLSDQVDSNTLEVEDPQRYNTRSMTTSGIISVIIVVFILGLVGLGTFIDYVGKQTPDKRLRGWKALITSFSITSNFEKLVTVPDHYDHLQLFNGIRVFGMLNISFGHTYIYSFAAPLANPFRVFSMLRGFWHRWVFTPLYMVDVFFLMSGFLLAYLSLAEMAKRKGKMNWLMFVIHRLIRICPIYFFIFMIYINILPYMGSGPAWPSMNYKYKEVCENYWWTNLLFISNFVPSGKQACMGWTWFIVNDMQFYLCSPIILILHYKNKLLGYGGLVFLILTNMIITATETAENNYNPGVIYGLLDSYQFTHSYIKPYFRMGAYLVGMMFGCIYRGYVDSISKNEQNRDIELGSVEETHLIPSPSRRQGKLANLEVAMIKWVHVKILRWVGYAFGIFIMLAVLYAPYNFETNGPDSWTLAAKAIYLAFEHIFFSVGLLLCLLPMVVGFGGSMLKLLTYKYLAVVAKISFSYYLIHPVFIHYYTLNKHQSLYLQDGDLIYSFFTTALLSTFTATILTLIIESPIMSLEKKLFRR